MLLPEAFRGPDGFCNFIYYVWDRIGLPHPTKIQYDIARWVSGGPRRRGIEGFRGVAKSYITAAYIVWRGLDNPDVKVLLLSASKQRADNLAGFIRQIINALGDLGKPLIPRVEEGHRDSAVTFDFGAITRPSGSPSVMSRGVTSSNTGSRGDIIVCDDVCSWANTQTQPMRDKLRATIKELDGAILSVGGEALYLYTMQGEDDPMMDLGDRGFEIMMFPARVPDDQWLSEYGDRLCPYVRGLVDEGVPAGTPTDPDRFNEEELRERELTYGRTYFNLQFMLDSRMADEDKYPLKINDLMVTPLDPSVAYEKYVWSGHGDYAYDQTVLPCWGFRGDLFHRPMDTVGDMVPYTGTIIAIDPSGRGSDEQVCTIISALSGQLLVHEQLYHRVGYADEALVEIAKKAFEYKANKIIYEENFGEEMFARLLHPHLNRIYPCRVEPVRSNMQKEKRICDVLEPVLNGHRLITSERLWRQDLKAAQRYNPEEQKVRSLQHQLSHITRQRACLPHDDRVDSLALGVAYWTRTLSLDVDSEMKRRQEELEDRAFAEFLESAGLHSGRSNNSFIPEKEGF